jgi:hypothetical protein
MFLERWKGAPGKIELYTLKPSVQRHFPVIYLASVRLQDELHGRFSVRGKLIATVHEEAQLELRRLSEALADFLRIPLTTREADAKGFSASLAFDVEGSKAVMTFKRSPSDTEIGPRLIVKNLIWSERI